MHTADFVLRGGDTAFTNRQKRLFDSLSDAEQECNKKKMIVEPVTEDMDVDERDKSEILPRAGRVHRSETRRFRGKESIFKRPEGPALRAARRTIPDYHRNPHKWVKYSLDDVSNEDMTEESNTRAALSFLKELKTRRSLDQDEKMKGMDVDESISTERKDDKVTFKFKAAKTCSGIRFKKPTNEMEETQNAPVIIEHDDKPVFRSSKIIMPEYIVGQKQRKQNKKEKPVEKINRLKQMKLDHLNEPDKEEG